MSKRSKSPRDLCARWHEDDGVNPRMDRAPDEKRAERKDLQLCKQVMMAINAALGSEAGSPLLRELNVVAVEAAPDASRVRVHVDGPPLKRIGVSAVLSELNRARGFLRTQIAEAISRKRVPELVFVPASGEEVNDE